MKKRKKINYKRRRRNLIIGIIVFLIFIPNFLSYLDKRESRKLAEKTFREKSDSEIILESE